MGQWEPLPQEDWDEESWRFKPLPSYKQLGIFPVQREERAGDTIQQLSALDCFWSTGVNHHWRQSHVQTDQEFALSPRFQQEVCTNDLSDTGRKALKGAFGCPCSAHLILSTFLLSGTRSESWDHIPRVMKASKKRSVSPTGRHKGGRQTQHQQKTWHRFSRDSKYSRHAVIEM